MGRHSAHQLPAGIYLDKHGVYWATLVGEYARLWRDRHPGLTLPRRKAATITAAVALQRELIDALKTQRKPKAENPTVAAWVERWIEQRQAIRPNTRKRYLQSLHYQIKPLRIGRIRLRQLSRDLVREWVNELIDLPRHDDPERTLNSYSIRNAFAVLQAALNSAVVDALLVGNPCHKVELPLIDYQEMRFMTSAQVKGLLNVLDTYERVKHTGGHRPHRQAALYHYGHPLWAAQRRTERAALA